MRKNKNKKKYNLGGAITNLFSNVANGGFNDVGPGNRSEKIGNTIGNVAGDLIPGFGPAGELLGNLLGKFGGMFDKKGANPMKSTGEVTSNPYGQIKDGGLVKYNGSKHENGGIPIGKDMKPTNRKNAIAEVEDGETSYKDYVFSDTLGKDGKTFAKLSKKIENKYKGREDDLAKKTMNLELSKLMGSNEQERVKKEQADTFRYGGDTQASDEMSGSSGAGDSSTPRQPTPLYTNTPNSILPPYLSKVPEDLSLKKDSSNILNMFGGLGNLFGGNNNAKKYPTIGDNFKMREQVTSAKIPNQTPQVSKKPISNIGKSDNKLAINYNNQHFNDKLPTAKNGGKIKKLQYGGTGDPPKEIKGTPDSYFDLANPFDDRVITAPGKSESISDYERKLKYPNPNQVTPMRKYRNVNDINKITPNKLNTVSAGDDKNGRTSSNPNLNIGSDRFIDPELAAKYDKEQQTVERQTAIRDALGINSNNENNENLSEEAKKKGLHYLTPAIIGKGTELLGKGAMLAQGYDKVDPNYNRYEGKVKDIMSKRGVDMDAVINQINLQRNSRLKSNQNARSLNVKRSLDNQAYQNTSQQVAGTELQKQQINNQLRGEEARQLDTLGQQRVQAKTYAEDTEARNKGQYFTNMGTFLGDVGRAGAFGTKYLANDYKTKEMLKIIGDKYEDFGLTKDIMKRLENGTASESEYMYFESVSNEIENKKSSKAKTKKED